MKKLLWFGAPLLLAIGVLAGGGASVFAAGPPSSPPGQDPCSHGNSDKACRPDPSPNGKDCDPHGKNGVGGVNEDHCLGTPATTADVPVTTTPVTTTVSTDSTTPSTTTTVSPSTSTESSSATTGPTTQTSPIAAPKTTPANSGTIGTPTPPVRGEKQPAGGVAGAQASKEPRATAKSKRSAAIAAAKAKAPSVLPFTP
jgi:hypothetical protein